MIELLSSSSLFVKLLLLLSLLAHAVMSQSDNSFIIKACISGVSCAIIAAGLNGVDVAKIRMQNQSAPSGPYVYLLSSIRRIYLEERVTGLCKGIYPSILRELSYSSIRLGAYEPIRKVLARSLVSIGLSQNNITTTDINRVDPRSSNPLVKFASGFVTGGVGSALCNPFDLAKTTFQAQLPSEPSPSHHSSTRAFLYHIFRQHGVWRGLYKGAAVTSMRSAVLTSAQIGSYDSIKNNLLIQSFHLEEGFLVHFLTSMTAGVITTTACNPSKIYEMIQLLVDSSAAVIYRGCVAWVIPNPSHFPL